MFYPLEGDTSHQDDFLAVLMGSFLWWSILNTRETLLQSLTINIQNDSKVLLGFPFIGHGNLDSNLETLCVTCMEWNQAKTIMGDSFSSGLIIREKMYTLQWTVVKLVTPAERKRT